MTTIDDIRHELIGMAGVIDDMTIVEKMVYEQMTALEEKELMQKHFIRKYGVRSSILDVVIEVLKKEEKNKNDKRKD